MTRSASMCCSTPRPPHAGQARNGLLNENSRGSISGMVKPDTGQAKRSEKIRRCGPLWSWILAVLLSRPAGSACSLPPCGGGVGRGADRESRAGGLPPSLSLPHKGGGDDDREAAFAGKLGSPRCFNETSAT